MITGVLRRRDRVGLAIKAYVDIEILSVQVDPFIGGVGRLVDNLEGVS